MRPPFDIEFVLKGIVGTASPVLGVVTSFQEQIEWHLLFGGDRPSEMTTVDFAQGAPSGGMVTVTAHHRHRDPGQALRGRRGDAGLTRFHTDNSSGPAAYFGPATAYPAAAEEDGRPPQVPTKRPK
jgi:hypothetical protein